MQLFRRPSAARNQNLPFRRLVGLLRPYASALVVSGVLLLFGTAAGLVFPLGIRQLIDSAFVTGNRSQLDRIALLLLGLFVLQAAADTAQGYLVARAGEKLVADLRVRLTSHVLRLSLRFFDEHLSGEISSILGNDVAMLRQGILDAALQVGPQLIRLIGSLVLAAALNWRLTLLVVVIAPVVGALTAWTGRRVRATTSASLQRLADATAVLNEALTVPRVVKAFGREDYETERYTARIQESLAESLRRAWLQAILGPINEVLFSWTMVAVLWFGGQEVLAGRLTPGDLVAFIIYFGQIAGPVAQLSRGYTQIQAALGAGQRVFNLLDEPPRVADRPAARRVPRPVGRVAFEKVTFAYAPDRPAVQDVSFVVDPGLTVALVGPSGAGKTTLTALLLRLYDVNAGRVVVDGVDIREATQDSLRAAMALVPQEPVLFSATVAENIRYGRLDATDLEVQAAARAANADEFIQRLPRGFATEVGERGIQLSVGQRQRIAIARAILRDPAILLLDEATASLDNESEYLVQEALARLMRGRTTLVIAHRLTTIEKADWIVVLDRGRVVEQGPPETLARSGGLYQRLLTRNFAEDGWQGAVVGE